MKDRLTPGQSQRLIELGVDPSKASSQNIYMKQGYGFHTPIAQPIFTLSDILSLLPKEIHDAEINVMFYLTIETDCNGTWLATYREYCGSEIAMEIGEKVAPELIDALFELLVWVLENHQESINQD